jgi:hypothetical protein
LNEAGCKEVIYGADLIIALLMVMEPSFPENGIPNADVLGMLKAEHREFRNDSR